eukprot:scaffold328082_cov17-Prasinocladus_malaysianus.AAC.1
MALYRGIAGPFLKLLDRSTTSGDLKLLPNVPVLDVVRTSKDPFAAFFVTGKASPAVPYRSAALYATRARIWQGHFHFLRLLAGGDERIDETFKYEYDYE